MPISQAELLDEVKCFCGTGASTAQLIIIALLQRIAEGSCGECPENLSGADSPLNVVTPDFEDQVYVQTGGIVWQAGSTASSSWTVICEGSSPSENGGLVWGPTPETVDSINADSNALSQFLNLTLFGGAAYTTLSFGSPVDVTNDVDFEDCDELTSLEFRLLESIGGGFFLGACTLLESISLPGLATVGGDIDFSSCESLEALSIPLLTSVGDSVVISTMTALTSLNLPLLATVTDNYEVSGSQLTSISQVLLESVGGNVGISSNSLLASVSFPILETVGDAFTLTDSVLTSLSLPSLTTISNFVQIDNTPTLTSFSAPLWVPTDGTLITFAGDGLDATSVNHILARCVSGALTTATIDLSGGTNAAPTGQGIVDAAALVTAGCSVTTN